MSPQLNSNGGSWRPRWWVRLTTIVAYVWGLVLATVEVRGEGRPEVLAFAGTLVLLGMGLSAVADRAFRR